MKTTRRVSEVGYAREQVVDPGAVIGLLATGDEQLAHELRVTGHLRCVGAVPLGEQFRLSEVIAPLIQDLRVRAEVTEDPHLVCEPVASE